MKQKEIEHLESCQKQQEDGLKCSQTMLEQDTKHFLNFFNKIKTDTQTATDDLDNVKKLKSEK